MAETRFPISDCSGLKGVRLYVCQGELADGKPIVLDEDKRQKYLIAWEVVGEEEVAKWNKKHGIEFTEKTVITKAVSHRSSIELGDAVEALLSSVGITEERVTKWIGRPCGCKGRQERLNKISRWAKMYTKKKTRRAKKALKKLLGD